MEKLFYRLCFGLNDIGEFYSFNKSPYDGIKNLDQEIFKSVFYYTEDQLIEAEKMVKVKNKNGEVYERKRGIGRLTLEDGTRLPTMEGKTNQLIFDFDAEDIKSARQDAVELINRLVTKGIQESDIDCVFSAGKGFHVKIQTNQFFTSSELKSICSVLMDGLTTADTTVYNDARILRLPHSRHHSGLYTTPLEVSELRSMSIESIKKIAAEKYEPDLLNRSIDLPNSIIEYKDLVVKNNKDAPRQLIKDLPEKFDIDFSKKPTYLTPAKYVLEMGFIPRGYGQEARMILAASYKKAGKDERQAYYALKAVSEHRVELYGPDAKFDKDEMWNNVIETVYSDSWQGGTYNHFHPLLSEIDDRLPAYLKRKERSNIIDNDSVFDKFKVFARDIDKNTIQFGIPSLDKNLRLVTGTHVGINGCPGSGKTTLLMNLLSNNSLKNEQGIFFSYDMNESLVALKQMQRICNLDNRQIYDLLRSNPKKFDELEKKAKLEFANVSFCFKTGATPDDIRNTIDEREQKTGEKVRLVGVDYLESIQSGYSDPSVGSGAVSQQLTDIANEMNVLMVTLLQTQKNVQPGDPIYSMRQVKGSSLIEQGLTVAIGIYREGQQLKYRDYDCTMGVNVLKNRLGELSENTVGWEGARSRIMEMTDDQRLQLTELREMRKQDEEDAKKQGW